MGKVKYAFFVASLFVVIGALYVHDRLAGVKMNKRILSFRDEWWEDEQDQGS